MNGIQLTGGTAIIAGLISILLGIANCFFGYRIFRVLLGIIGFIGGAAAGLAIIQALVVAGNISSSGSLLYYILAALIGGAIGAVLLIFVYFIGVFLLGALMGLLLGSYIAQAVGGGDNVILIAAIVLALVGGILALILQRAVIIIATAISGAYSIVWGIALLVSPGVVTRMLSGQTAIMQSAPVLLLVGWVILAIAGMVVQFAWTGKKKPKPIAAGAVPAGTAPQVIVQQYNVPGQPAQQPPSAPPIVVQSQPMATPPPPVIPTVVQSAPPPPPTIPAPAQSYVPPLPAPEEEVQSFPTPTAGGSKFCPNCGQPVAYGTTFCTNCGSSVSHLWQ
jgi:hypothetical protein